MTVEEMAALAKEHCKEVNPKVYRRMVKRGDLEASALASARLTLMKMKTLMHGGFMSEDEAWQASRTLFIFCDPAKEYHP